MNRKNQVLGLIILVAVLCRLPLLWADFTNYDDRTLLLDNPVIGQPSFAHAWQLISTNFRQEGQAPMHLFNMFNLWLTGPWYPGFAVISLLWFAATLVVIYRFTELYLPTPTVRLAAVAWFAVNSVHVDTLAWVSARCHWLGLPFALGSLILWRRWRDEQRGYLYILAVSCGAFTLMNKPIYLIAPILPLIDDWICRRKLSRSMLWEYGIPLAFIGWRLTLPPLYSVHRVAEAVTPEGLTPTSLIIVRIQALVQYLWYAVVPQPTSIALRGLPGMTWMGDGGIGLPVYASPPLLSVAILFGVAALALWWTRWSRIPAGLLTIAALIAMTTMWPRARAPGMAFEVRYTLVPSLLVAVTVCLMIHRLWPKLRVQMKGLVAVFFSVLLLGNIVVGWRQAESFVDGKHWAHCIKYFPVSDVCVFRRSQQLMLDKQPDKARKILETYEEQRLMYPLLPNPGIASQQLVKAYRAIGDHGGELFWLQRALLDPTLPASTTTTMKHRVVVLRGTSPPP